MGMDVYGSAPTAEVGAYFRNNVWWWRPLADYLVERYPELTAPCVEWQTNSGDGLSAEASVKLADAIDADLSSGYVASWGLLYKIGQSSLPLVTCDLCAGTGMRTDQTGRNLGMDVPRDAVTGRGGCNGCAGTGEHKQFVCSYVFDVDNVKDFSEFMRASGGFEIL